MPKYRELGGCGSPRSKQTFFERYSTKLSGTIMPPRGNSSKIMTADLGKYSHHMFVGYFSDLNSYDYITMSCTQPSHPRFVRCDILSTSSRTPKRQRFFLTMTKHNFFTQKASFPPVASSGQYLRLRPAHHLPALVTVVLYMPLPICFTQRPL